MNEIEQLKNPFRITIENYNQKSIVEVDHSDVDIYEAASLMRNALLAAGYAEQSVDQIVSEDVV